MRFVVMYLLFFVFVVFLQVGVGLDVQWSRLTETLPMSTHDIQKSRNFIIVLNTSSYLELCRKVFISKCDKPKKSDLNFNTIFVFVTVDMNYYAYSRTSI